MSDTKSAFERCNRAALQATADQAMEEVVKRLSLDAAADRMAVAFLQQRLPPQPTSGTSPFIMWSGHLATVP